MRRTIWRWIKIWVLVLVGVSLGWLCYEFITFPSISRLRNENPATTALIDTRAQEAAARGEQPKQVQVWVPLEKISPNLQRAVLAGEDSNFAAHHGFDYDAIQRAWDEAQREAQKEAKQEGDDQSSWIPQMPDFKRGASTISQQLAKNLYLTTQKSFLRKGREAVITYFLERELPKRRIMEIYLNVIEWGDGIYGAEAASQYYFRKPASNLSAREAAFLSAIIPNPRKDFNPQLNPRRVARRQRIIMRGMPHVKLPPGTG
ncbi:MAG: transglycosylase domain-containing protein [Pyrinomonadaceae bacterium]